MNHQVAVIGLGIFGTQVALSLADRNFSVMALDTDPEAVEAVHERVTRALVLDSTQKRALLDAGVSEIETVVVAIGTSHIEDSIMTVALLKECGVRHIVARAVSELHERILRQVGATLVVNPEREMGEKIAGKIARPGFYDLFQLPDGVCVAEVNLPESFEGKNLLELDVRRNYEINVLGVQRAGQKGGERRMLTNLAPDSFRFEKDDILVVMGRQKNIDRLL